SWGLSSLQPARARAATAASIITTFFFIGHSPIVGDGAELARSNSCHQRVVTQDAGEILAGVTIAITACRT
ncbi:hypothetical protein, partial [Enterobacter hormaechei]|uniref:hypothetical protein n=1 Tax=Enterobacter hormaechei TaxID=158836 RepID=UPI001CC3188A